MGKESGINVDYDHLDTEYLDEMSHGNEYAIADHILKKLNQLLLLYARLSDMYGHKMII